MQRLDLQLNKQPYSSKRMTEFYNKMKHKGNADGRTAPTGANASEIGTETKNTRIQCIYSHHARSKQLQTLPSRTSGRNHTTNQLKSVKSAKDLEISCQERKTSRSTGLNKLAGTVPTPMAWDAPRPRHNRRTQSPRVLHR